MPGKEYSEVAPSRGEVDEMAGPVVIDFGTNWCGYCQAAQPLINQAFVAHPGVRHIKVEDGPGRQLGRSFRVKLWPTLIFLLNGQEVERVVRPVDADEIGQALAQIDPGVS